MASQCEHEAIEQVRGLMTKDDFFDVWANDLQAAYVDRLPQHYASIVEINRDNVTDFRIICRRCHLSTGWMKADLPGYPGVLKEANRKRWDEIKGFTILELEEANRKTAQRTETDVKKLFPDLEGLSSDHGRPVSGRS